MRVEHFNLISLLKLILLWMGIFSCSFANAQKSSYNQFWNDFQFVTPVSHNWSNEINLGQVWTSIPGLSNTPFHSNAQLYARIWLHYALKNWKLSVFTGYNHNPELMAVGQKGLPEFRSAVQGLYYFNKEGYTLSGRLRIEDHHKKKESGDFSDNYRIRGQLKFVKPLNAREVVKGTIYGVMSEELFTQASADVFSQPSFGSNRLMLGCGYALSDDLLIELDYSNDYYFYKNKQSSYHAMQLNFSMYNWIQYLKRL